ncbi:MAG: TonB-dependent siderophore receptor [Pseudomonas sp.]|uniref:TonB-dependent siderophore receptor n=1 Tax=Pseudomonas sp. TaxID=306 RepID=UPI003D129867
MRINESALRTPLNRAIRGALLGLSVVGSTLPGLVLAEETSTVSQTREWNIPAGPLSNALDTFARQAGISLSYASSDTASKASPGVQGNFDTFQALSQLLQGSGLQAMQQSTTSYLLLPQAPATADGVLELGATSVTAQGLGGVTEGSRSYTTGTVSIGKTPQSLRRTPQSVTVLTEQRMKDQNLTNLKQMLQQTPGVVVDQTDSERVTYHSRGYRIDALQFDGATLNIDWASGNFIQPDVATLDHVEVLRGASGMLRGSGNPSGTVNMVRKRPTREFQGSASYTLGSWDANRYVADLSGPLVEGGAIRGRIIAVHDDKDFFQDARMERKNVLYTVLAADLSDSTTLTGGLEYTEMDATGAWGGLVPDFDGSPLPFSRSTFLGANWARWDRTNVHAFAELDHAFDNGWNLKLSVNRSRLAYKDHGFQQTSLARPAPPRSPFATDPYIWDVNYNFNDGGGRTNYSNIGAVLDGPFELFGREHRLTVGTEWNEADAIGVESVWGYNALGVDVRNWNPSLVNKDRTGAAANAQGHTITTQKAAFASWNISLADPLTAILGARLNWYDFDNQLSENGDYEVNREVVPYAALIYDLTENISAYTSYTEIFTPQTSYDVAGTLLEPMTGEVYELGLKGEFYEGRLNSSIAVFRTNLIGKGLPDANASTLACKPNNAIGSCMTASGKSRSEGVELEISGEVLPGWQVGGGYTYTTTEYLKDSAALQGNVLRTTDPKHLLRLFTTYRLPDAYSAWTVGGGVQAQSDIYATGNYLGRPARAEQAGYAVYNAMLGYRIDEHYSLQLNANNLFDKYYYEKIGATGANYYYGEPRNFALTLRGEF